MFNADLITDKQPAAVILPLALFYGGLAQLLAGMEEFRKGSTFAAPACASFDSFWLAYAAYAKFVAGTLPVSTATSAIGCRRRGWSPERFMAPERISRYWV
ncbi:GPR1/FUN34/YaaH family transporter [Streptomyces sp. NPDC049541]|uniref:GPR1/FUN34/YaaH family transporter n=1 Tax=Streptomyces sp. NPDC049541 TaxID=3365594 RepID=UPI003797C095